MSMNRSATRTFDETDISSLEFWARPMAERDEAFAHLRRDRPVSFHRPPEGALFPKNDGFWALVRHADVVSASRHPELFCSGRGISMEDLPHEMEEAMASFLVMDAPRHTTMRRLVSHAFTPRQVARIEEAIRRQAVTIVADALTAGTIDVVETLAMRLPLWTISELLGVPEEIRARVYWAANTMVGLNDPDWVAPGDSGLETMMMAALELHQIAVDLAARRRERPEDDLMSALVAAEVDGERMSDEEIAAFFHLLTVAGNDTTRNSISHGVAAFAANPDQWTLLRSNIGDHLGPAVEEVVRWATPVLQFRRTATRDVELHGRRIAAGDWVVMFYLSANRDDAVFADPWRFDITRAPNEHVGFGGGGPHFCLGASLARTQLRAVFAELARSVVAFEAGETECLVGFFINGVKRLPCRLVVR
ncbi:MAG TPA: cytochrome P450 [Acidimicrobiia bacterium]|nr:cytochrome P450 [Acidimicrobiia bacterium]